MNCFWYGQNYRFFLSGILEGLVIVLSLMILLAWAKTILKKNFNATIFSLGGLLFLPVFIHILEHALFKTEFLSGRTAQYFVPLFLIAVIFSFASLFEKTSTVWIGAFSFLGLTHFFIAENLSYTSEWKYDCENKKAIEYLNRICKNDEMHPLQLTSNWMLEPGVNFYLSTQKIKNISPVHRENNLSENFDVYYVLASDTEQLQNRGKKILQGFPLSKTYVMK